VDALAAACPVPVMVDTPDASGATVTYAAPQVTGGVAPHTTTCTPVSGSHFAPGDTTVACTVRDAVQTAATCTFSVTVRVVIVPMLNKTIFLAFGDSITEGLVSEGGIPKAVYPAESYPTKLEALLRQFYPSQDIRVINAGESGEDPEEGEERLAGVLTATQPHVMLLLEGVNGLESVGIPESAQHLTDMVTTAQSRGIDVIIGRLLPITGEYVERFPKRPALLAQLNDEINRIAIRKNLGPPADFFGLFSSMPSLLGIDGLHPTRGGYTAMAETWFQEIASRYDRDGMIP
jgi:lysophospholipase L1-like esterase